MAKSAQETISEFWPDHVMHKKVGAAPRWDADQGIVCACGEVLGWPVEEPPEDAEPDWEPRHETLSQTLKREAQEQIDAARAKGEKSNVVTGAFGSYGGRAHEDVQLPEAIEDGDGEDVGTAPPPEGAQIDEHGNWVADGKSYGPATLEPDPQPVGDLPERLAAIGSADEAQSVDPWAVEGQNVGPDVPPWDDVDAPTTPPWAPGERSEAQEIADGSQAEYGVPSGAGVSSVVETGNAEVGRDVVPYAGVPIYPGEAQQLDPLIGRLAPLDPTLPYTPSDVELKIVSILRQLENSEEFLRQQLARLHQATHNHTMRYNLSIASSEAKAADQRKAEAVIATERELHEMTEAEMLVRALRDSQHNLRSQLSGFQSVARSLGVSLVNSLDGRDMPRKVESHREPPEPAPWEYQ